MSAKPRSSYIEALFSRESTPVARERLRIRTVEINAAEMKNDDESMMKAVLRPKLAVTNPPNAAPIANVTDHEADESAFAAISSSCETRLGIAADFAGSRKLAL